MRGSMWLIKLDAFELRRSRLRETSLMKLAASSLRATAGSLSMAEPRRAPCSGCAKTRETLVAGRCRFGVDSEDRHLGVDGRVCCWGPGEDMERGEDDGERVQGRARSVRAAPDSPATATRLTFRVHVAAGAPSVSDDVVPPVSSSESRLSSPIEEDWAPTRHHPDGPSQSENCLTRQNAASSRLSLLPPPSSPPLPLPSSLHPCPPSSS